MSEYTKQDYLAAQAASDAAWRALQATPEAAALDAANERLNAIRDELGDHLYICEGCGEPIFEGDPYTHDSEDGISCCVECSPTWQDLADRPGDFIDRTREGKDGAPVYLTAETVKPIIAAHLAAGGKLSDSMAASRRTDDA